MRCDNSAMGINTAKEKLLSVSSESHLLPTSPSKKQAYDWIRLGVVSHVSQKRVFLEHVRVGGVMKTSPEAVIRFLTEINEDEFVYEP